MRFDTTTGKLRVYIESHIPGMNLIQINRLTNICTKGK